MGIIETLQHQLQEQHRELQQVKHRQAIHDTILRHINYIPLREAMKMCGIKSTQGIHAAADRGELERRYKSEKKPEFSMASIITYLDKKGYKEERVKQIILN